MHRVSVLEIELGERTERCEVLQSSKDVLEASNERLSALCGNKDVSGGGHSDDCCDANN